MEEKKKFVLPDTVKEGNFIKVSVKSFDEFIDTKFLGKVKEIEEDDEVIMIYFDKMLTVMYSKEDELTPTGYAAEFSDDSAYCTIVKELADDDNVRFSESTEDEIIGLMSEAVNRFMY